MDTLALTLPPSPLTRREQLAGWGLALFAAILRWPAVSLTMWDWDEGLFMLALRDYDVTVHHPHPPGFPLFIAAAKWIPTDAFHALQTVTFVSALFVFPAMFLLARELRASAPVAMSAGLLLAFFPNVWFFGGTAFSDVPSTVLVITAAALLLRGCRSDASLLTGALLLGIAAGFRPQNLMIGLVPLAVAVRYRLRAGLTGVLLLGTIVIVTYSAAAAFSGGWQPYREALIRHEAYIRTTDSFLTPLHPGLVQVADDFFLRPFRMPLINGALIVLMAIGLVRRRSSGEQGAAASADSLFRHARILFFQFFRGPRLAVAIFGPFSLFAWLFLDFHSVSRFSIAYMPLYALLAAEGVDALPRHGRIATLVAIVTLMIGWTWPALRIVHETESPPVAAMRAIRTLPRATTEEVFVDDRLAPYADLLIPDYAPRIVRVTPPLVEDARAVLVREGTSSAAGALNFARDRDRLAEIARPRYFEVSVIPGRRP